MNKLIIITDVSDDCYQVTAEIKCDGFIKDQVHVLGYNQDELELRQRAYKILQDQLKELGIE